MKNIYVCVVLGIFGSLWATAGIIIGRKFYKNVQKEHHQEKGKVIQRIMKTFAIVQCTVWPIVMILAWLLYVNKSLFDRIDHNWIRHTISSSRFFYTWFRGYIGYNSLIIALCRYSFIVHENLVIKAGFKRIRYFYLGSSIVIPILLALFTELLIPIELAWICLFMPQSNQTDHDSNDVGLFCTKNTTSSMDNDFYCIFLIHYL